MDPDGPLSPPPCKSNAMFLPSPETTMPHPPLLIFYVQLLQLVAFSKLLLLMF